MSHEQWNFFTNSPLTTLLFSLAMEIVAFSKASSTSLTGESLSIMSDEELWWSRDPRITACILRVGVVLKLIIDFNVMVLFFGVLKTE